MQCGDCLLLECQEASNTQRYFRRVPVSYFLQSTDGGDKGTEAKINYFQLNQPATLSMCPQATQVILTIPPTPTPTLQSDTRTTNTCAYTLSHIHLLCDCLFVFSGLIIDLETIAVKMAKNAGLFSPQCVIFKLYRTYKSSI